MMYNLGMQAPQTYPMNMNPVTYSDEDTAQANNGQLEQDGKNLVKKQDMAKTFNAVKNDLVNKMLKLNLTDNTKTKNISQSVENNSNKNDDVKEKSEYQCDASSENVRDLSEGYSPEQLLTESIDSGLGELELSTSSEASVDRSLLSNDSVDNLDSPSDSSSQYSASSSVSDTSFSRSCSCQYHHYHIQNKGIMLTAPQLKPLDLKRAVSVNGQSMKPIPIRFRFMLDEEARKNPSQNPKRFEGQPLVRHKPLGNRKRKLARLAHIAYMMEVGSDKAKAFEFNPDAECFQPRQTIGSEESGQECENISSHSNAGKTSPVVKSKNQHLDQSRSRCNSESDLVPANITKEDTSNTSENIVKTDTVDSKAQSSNSVNSKSVKTNISAQPSDTHTKPVYRNTQDTSAVHAAKQENVINTAKRPFSYVTYLVPGQKDSKHMCPSFSMVSGAHSTENVINYQTSMNGWNNEINNNVVANQPPAVTCNIAVDNANYEHIVNPTFCPTSTGCVPASPITPTAVPLPPPPAPGMVINSPVLLSFPPLPPPPSQAAPAQQPPVMVTAGQQLQQQQAVSVSQPQQVIPPTEGMMAMQNQQQSGQMMSSHAMLQPAPMPTGTVYYSNIYQQQAQMLPGAAYSMAPPTSPCEPLPYGLPAEQPYY